MKLLLVGSEGQVGHEVKRLAELRGLTIVGLGHEALDISVSRAVGEAFGRHEPSVVVNAAAYTDVDKAEQEVDIAFAANRDGPMNLATACADRGVPLIHLSTDCVFDGRNSSAYRENDQAAPLAVYGQSKFEGEQAVVRRLPSHIILRVSWVFSSRRQNFVKSILRLAETGESLRVVSDQHGCPTAASDIADVVLSLVERIQSGGFSQWGVYHYCGRPRTTRYGFAQAILDEARKHMAHLQNSVVPVATSEFPTRAVRPANSVLDCQKIENTFGIQPAPWKSALKKVVEEICRE